MRSVNEGAQGERLVFATPAEAIMAYDAGELDLHAQITVRIKGHVAEVGTVVEEVDEERTSIVETSLGRTLFNEALPVDYPYINTTVDRKVLSQIVNDLAERYPKVAVAASLDALMEAGFNRSEERRVGTE